MPVIGECEIVPETKEQRREVKYMLRAALHDMNVKMVSDREYTSVGLQYTDRFTSYMEVLSAMSLLPWWQKVALVRNLGPERATQEKIAAAFGVRRETVCHYIIDGLDTMAARIYEKLTSQT